MEIARTPAERFDVVEGFDHEPAWVEVDGPSGLRMAYVAAGPADGPVVVLVHGEPTWGYLYRRMVPPLVAAGLRVVVPDLIGCGRSDKPAKRAAYSYAAHVEWLRAGLFDGLGLGEVDYVGQDWGGLLGMRLLAENPDRFAGVVMSNTGLPTGDVPMPEAWQRFPGDGPHGAPARRRADGRLRMPARRSPRPSGRHTRHRSRARSTARASGSFPTWSPTPPTTPPPPRTAPRGRGSPL